MVRLFIALVLTALASGASACQTPPQAQLDLADTILVGYVAAVSIPELESLADGSDKLSVQSMMLNHHRVINLAVIETRKGTPVVRQLIEAQRCTGYAEPGDYVVAHYLDGIWRISKLPHARYYRVNNGP